MNRPRVHQRSGVASDIGLRENNEDAFLLRDLCIDRGPVLARLAVADGMGGHQAGATASRLAIDAVATALGDDPGDVDAMARAFGRADDEIRQFAVSLGAGQSMGTTLTFAVVLQHEAIIGHVGDSRAWLHHGGVLEQITADHSRVGRLERAGVISEREVIGHPEANLLEQALGTGDRPRPDVYRVGLGPGDVLLLSTDGLHGALRRDEIVGILVATPSMQLACERLVTVAQESGSRDNVTVVAWQYPSRAARTKTIPGAVARPHRSIPRRRQALLRATRRLIRGVGRHERIRQVAACGAVVLFLLVVSR